VGTADFRPILKAEMRALDADLAMAIAKTSDRMSKAHLEDAREQIKTMKCGIRVTVIPRSDEIRVGRHPPLRRNPPPSVRRARSC